MDAAEACLIVRLPGLRAGVCAGGQVVLRADRSVFPSCPVCEAQVTEEVSAAAERPCAVLAPGAAGAVSPRRLRAFARVSSAALRARKGGRVVGVVGAALRQVDTRCLCARQIA